MRIISNEHDYYDCVQRVDHDRSVIYQRHPVKTEWERKDWPFPEPPMMVLPTFFSKHGMLIVIGSFLLPHYTAPSEKSEVPLAIYRPHAILGDKEERA